MTSERHISRNRVRGCLGPEAYRMGGPTDDSPFSQSFRFASHASETTEARHVICIACNRHVISTTRHKRHVHTQAAAGGAPPRRAVTPHTVTFYSSRNCTAWPTVEQSSRNRRFRQPPGGATACPNSGSSPSRANGIATAATSASAATAVASSHGRRTTGGHGAAGFASYALNRLAGAAKWRTFE